MEHQDNMYTNAPVRGGDSTAAAYAEFLRIYMEWMNSDYLRMFLATRDEKRTAYRKKQQNILSEKQKAELKPLQKRLDESQNKKRAELIKGLNAIGIENPAEYIVELEDNVEAKYEYLELEKLAEQLSKDLERRQKAKRSYIDTLSALSLKEADIENPPDGSGYKELNELAKELNDEFEAKIDTLSVLSLEETDIENPPDDSGYNELSKLAEELNDEFEAKYAEDLEKLQIEFTKEMVRDASRQHAAYTFTTPMRKSGDEQCGVEFDECVNEAYDIPLKYNLGRHSFADYLDNCFVEKLYEKLYQYARALLLEENTSKSTEKPGKNIRISEDQIMARIEEIIVTDRKALQVYSQNGAAQIKPKPKTVIGSLSGEIDYEKIYATGMADQLRKTVRNFLSREYEQIKKQRSHISLTVEGDDETDYNPGLYVADSILPLDIVLEKERFAEILLKLRASVKSEQAAGNIERVFVLKYLGDMQRKTISETVGISETMVSRYTTKIKAVLASLGLEAESEKVRNARRKRYKKYQEQKKDWEAARKKAAEEK